MVDETYADEIRRACWKVTENLDVLSKYVKEFQVTFQRVKDGAFIPAITVTVTNNRGSEIQITKGAITNLEMAMKAPTEEELVWYFADLDDKILDHVDISKLVWDRLTDYWFQFRGKVAHLRW